MVIFESYKNYIQNRHNNNRYILGSFQFEKYNRKNKHTNKTD